MSHTRSRSYRYVAAMLLGALACAPRPVLEGADLSALRGLTEQVEEARLMEFVREGSRAHLEDAKVDCSTLRSQVYPALCQLSRGRSATLLQSRLEALGLQVRRQEEAGQLYPTSNIIVDIPGVTHPEEILLIGAHYDAFYAGADDNTTGVAALVEVARILSQHRFDRTLRFVGFDMEEFGDIGSARYVRAQRGERLVGAIIYDSIGYYDTQVGSQGSLPGLPSPSTGDFLAIISNERSSHQAAELYALNEALGVMKVTAIIAPRDGASFLGGNLMRSDHAPFWLSGQSALFLTDTANFRNPHYHRESDTVDTLHPALFSKAVQLSLAGVAYWAGGPR